MAEFKNQKDFTKRKSNYRKSLKNGVEEIKNRFEESVVNLALIIKNNAEIRRFTALGIINYLKKENIINGTHNRVSFKWNKFAVISDGLVNEYKYSELFFINALVASFSNFSANAEITINKFCEDKLNQSINEIVNEGTINLIVIENESYLNSKHCTTVVDDGEEDNAEK